MSLDVYLRMPGTMRKSDARIFIREDGQTKEISRAEWDMRYPGREPLTLTASDTDEIYSANITHNLGSMAAAAGLYMPLWHPEDIGAVCARDLIGPLRAGLARLEADPARFAPFSPSNGWGTYEGLCLFVSDYLAACEQYPDAEVSVMRSMTIAIISW